VPSITLPITVKLLSLFLVWILPSCHIELSLNVWFTQIHDLCWKWRIFLENFDFVALVPDSTQIYLSAFSWLMLRGRLDWVYTIQKATILHQHNVALCHGNLIHPVFRSVNGFSESSGDIIIRPLWFGSQFSTITVI